MLAQLDLTKCRTACVRVFEYLPEELKDIDAVDERYPVVQNGKVALEEGGCDWMTQHLVCLLPQRIKVALFVMFRGPEVETRSQGFYVRRFAR